MSYSPSNSSTNSNSNMIDNNNNPTSGIDINFQKSPINTTTTVSDADNDNYDRSCRICLDSIPVDDLISPCYCKGGSSYVHRQCLDSWRATNVNGTAFTNCDICKMEYQIEPIIEDPELDRKRVWLYRFYCTRDLLGFLALTQLIIIGLLFIIKAADSSKLKILHLFPEYLQSKEFLVYWLSSLILILAIIGLIGIMAYCCGCFSQGYQQHYYSSPSLCGDCTCYYCFWVDCNNGPCNNTNCNCDCGGSNDSGAPILLVIAIVIVILLAIVGLFIGVVLSGILVERISRRHFKRLWLKQETQKFRVKDYQYCRELLPTIIPTASTVASDSTIIDINNNNNNSIINPSAPTMADSINQQPPSYQGIYTRAAEKNQLLADTHYNLQSD